MGTGRGKGDETGQHQIERKSKFRNATNANGSGTQTRQVGKVLGQSDTQGETGGFVNDALQRNASYSNSNGLNERNGNDEINTSEGGEYALGHIGESNDNGNTSNTNGIGSIQRNTIAIGELSKRDGFEALCQSTNWENFPTQSPVCGGDDGLPTELDGITFPKWRAESIKGYGNAIVPQIAYQLFQIINDL
jgi:hypothetical protein